MFHLLAADAGVTTSATRVTGSSYGVVIGVAVVALCALAVAYGLRREVLAASEGSTTMRDIARAVQEGASAYLTRQFRTLSIFAVLLFAILFVLPADTTGERVGRSLFFLVGAVFSATTGYTGMWLAVRANVRVAAAAHDPAAGYPRALRIAFRAGGVAGMFTVGMGLLGAAIVVLIFNNHAPLVLEGYGFGAALLAMFMRVGGGIFTKAADVGADLVGKVEQNIPEDDPRNAATIADNVGDNVGDCAGMAADLFESYAVTLVAALVLGSKAFGYHGLVFPLIVPALGVITAVIGIFLVSPRAGDRNAMAAINRGFFFSALISAVFVVIAAWIYLPSTFSGLPGGVHASGNPRVIAIVAVVIGLILAAAIQLLTGYFTETNRKPVKDVADAALTGPATTVLSGISVGLESAVYSAILICGAVYSAYRLGGGNVTVALFAIALAGTGLLTTVGVIVSMDTFGPVSDNAQGIAEMAGATEDPGASVLTSLDAVGNTTKAITKGIAIATAVLAATALFGSYRESVVTAINAAGIKDAVASGGVLTGKWALSVDRPDVLVGLIIGAAVVFLFSGLAISAVGRAAQRVVFEVREQFRTKPGIMDFSERPDYARVVDICTADSLRELMVPGLLAVLAPIAVGFGLGYAPLGAYLGGAIAAGVLMAIFLANSGGAWDNAKKLVEDGVHGGKGSEAHHATVIGDTVGDPFKDTAGPAINPLIKVMNLVSVLIAPSVVKYAVGSHASTPIRATTTLLALTILVVVIVYSKRRAVPSTAGTSEPDRQPARAA